MAPIRHMTDINNVAVMEELAEWMRTKKVKNWSDKEKKKIAQTGLASRKPTQRPMVPTDGPTNLRSEDDTSLES